jgi:hypothetical protein
VIEREIRDLKAQERHVIIGFLIVIAGALVALGIATVVMQAAC